MLVTVPVKITREMNELLLKTFNSEEVKTALFQMFPTKYPTHFFQKHWELCSEEVTSVVLRVLCVCVWGGGAGEEMSCPSSTIPV